MSDTTFFTEIPVEAWQIREGDRIQPFGHPEDPWQTVETVSAKFSDSPILEDWVVLLTDTSSHSASPGVIYMLRVPGGWVNGWRYRQAVTCGCVERLVGDSASETVRVFSCPTHGADVPGFGGWNQRDDDTDEEEPDL